MPDLLACMAAPVIGHRVRDPVPRAVNTLKLCPPDTPARYNFYKKPRHRFLPFCPRLVRGRSIQETGLTQFRAHVNERNCHRLFLTCTSFLCVQEMGGRMGNFVHTRQNELTFFSLCCRK